MAEVYMAGDVRNGTTFEMDGGVFRVVEFQHVKPGKGAAFVRTKLKNVINGSVIEKTFNPSEKLQGADIEKREMQYLYADGDLYYFMDNDTYDQVSIPKSRLEWELNFLVPNKVATITYYNEEVVGIELPAKVSLRIAETADAVRGDTVNKALKDAYLETGLKVRVPLFVENNEEIIVCTSDGSYDSRAK